MDFISILGDTGFLACRRCKFSILPSRIEFYFSKAPHRLSVEDRRRRASEIERYPELVAGPSDLREVEIPSSFPYFFSELSLYSDGFQCHECLYLSRDRQTIVKHYKEEHGWENPRKRGEKISKNEEDTPWKSNIPCQRFFNSAPKNTYFQVDPKRAFGEEASPREVSLDGGERDGNREIREIRSRSYSIHSQGIFLR